MPAFVAEVLLDDPLTILVGLRTNYVLTATFRTIRHHQILIELAGIYVTNSHSASPCVRLRRQYYRLLRNTTSLPTKL